MSGVFGYAALGRFLAPVAAVLCVLAGVAVGWTVRRRGGRCSGPGRAGPAGRGGAGGAAPDGLAAGRSSRRPRTGPRSRPTSTGCWPSWGGTGWCPAGCRSGWTRLRPAVEFRPALAWKLDVPLAASAHSVVNGTGVSFTQRGSPIERNLAAQPLARRPPGAANRAVGGLRPVLLADPRVSAEAGPHRLLACPAMPTLSVIVPATDRPATLPRATAALARAAGSAEVIVVDGPATLSVCAARNAGRERATGDVLVFVDADVEIHADALVRIADAFATDPGLTAVFGSYDDAPSRGGPVAAFRNLLHHHVHQGAAGPAADVLVGAGRGAPGRLPAPPAGSTRTASPHPSVEDIDLGVRLVARRRPDRAGPGDPGHAPQGVDAAARWWSPTSPGAACRGWRCCCATGGPVHGVEPRLAAPGQRARPAHSACWRCWPGGRAPAGSRARGAARAEPRLLPAAGPPARGGRGAARGRACTRCTT